MTVKTDELISFLETKFDIKKQCQWDFSGKQIYTGNKTVNKILLSLDITESTVDKAIDTGCELIITHHPIFLNKYQGIDTNRIKDQLIVKAIKNNIDILSYHTNLDINNEGINDYLCDLLNGKAEKGYLAKEGEITLCKLIVFTPLSHKEKVFEAATKYEAGKIGNYSKCGFISEGEGRFTPNDKASPFIGSNNKNEKVTEVKIEVLVEEQYLKNTLEAVKEAHPYEEPAYDIFKLINSLDYGIGKICKLNKDYTLTSFINFIKEKLQTTNIKTNMKECTPFNKIGICSGSGASLWKECKRKDIHILLTGDLKHHEALDAAEEGVCIIDATHQATEEIYLEHLKKLINEKFNIKIYINKRDVNIISWG